MNPKSYDFFGNIALVKFPEKFKSTEKKKFALKLLKEQKSIKTILEKTGKVKGRLRKFSTKFIAGENTKEVLYRENGCVFRFNIDSTYFSPRLSNERKEIADKIKKDEDVLVMFAGVAPFPVVIAKNSKAKSVTSVEINKEASKYAKLNVELNNLKNKLEIVQADVKKFAERNKQKKYDVIVMARPQLKDTFLKQAFMLSKKGTRIYYYDFTKIENQDKIIEKIKQEAKQYKKKIKITNIKEAGEIAPYKIRIRVDFNILS
ncbi:MAG: methyltransferase [archaeon]|nr:methyltransferase [archaeon]